MSSSALRLLLTWCLLLGAAAGSNRLCAQPATAVVGAPVSEFIDSLRDAGLQIVASSELVTAAMRITEAPPTGAPLEQLRAVLAPHGLDIVPGPRSSWLIVRIRPEPAVQPDAPPPPPFTVPPPSIDTIVVTASQYRFARTSSPSSERIDRLQLDHAPVLGDDALRTIHTLPGVTSSGLTARTNVRGGASDETLVLLDGVRLYSPFHLKDFESLFSTVSPHAIEHIDVYTGGYSARYGDRMSGVLDMRSLEPAERRHYEVGVTTLTSSFQSRGRFADDRGSWLTSIRRGNLDLLIDAANSDFGTPQYTDFFSKLDFELAGGGVIGGGVLSSDDKLTLVEAPTAAATADYGDNYVWLRYAHTPAPRIDASYRLARLRSTTQRAGQLDEPNVSTGQLKESRHFSVDTLAAEWGLRLNEEQRLDWGVELSRSSAVYDVGSTRIVPYPIQVANVEPIADDRVFVGGLEQSRRSLFVTYRVTPTSRVALELGGRWDRQTEPDEAQTSPRISMLFDVGDRTSLRASWGRFYQSPQLDELRATDGQTELGRAQRSDHSILSVEYLLSDRMTLRAEVYDKRIRRISERFENLFDRLSLVPELLPDRVRVAPERARARGMELSFEADADSGRWWVSVVRSSVEDRLEGTWVRRAWEEPWAAKGGFIWVGPRWSASVTATTRSGWPISRLEIVDDELVVGQSNGDSFESFRSIDLSASRTIALRHGSIEFLLQLNNALDFDNPCCLDYAIETGPNGELLGLSGDTDFFLPSVPTLGFLWRFGAE